jgi:hypothetical protein
MRGYGMRRCGVPLVEKLGEWDSAYSENSGRMLLGPTSTRQQLRSAPGRAGCGCGCQLAAGDWAGYHKAQAERRVAVAVALGGMRWIVSCRVVSRRVVSLVSDWCSV